MNKVDAHLLQVLKQAEKNKDLQRIAVIIRYRPKADLNKLKLKGFNVSKIFENIHAVSGTLIPYDVTGIAELDEVEQIEFDGKMHAL